MKKNEIRINKSVVDKISGEVFQAEIECEAVQEKATGRLIESNVIGLYPNYTFQTIEGFGCAMTESACYLLSRMEPKVRKEAIRCWFGPGGIDARFVRIPIDSCDYSLSEYQAVEKPLEDPELKSFDIKRDRKYIIPVVKEILEETDTQLSALLSPWSPPAEWKTPPELTENDVAVYGGMGIACDYTKPGRSFGGRLKPEYYNSWAQYLVKYIKAYMEEGIPVTMLSIQNEAAAATPWDSCVWSGEQEKIFLKQFLYPAMQKAGLTDKIEIFVWDHNKERMVEHIDEIFQDDTMDLVDGIAYHWYTGDHFDALSLIHGKYPDKVLMHSESCGLHIPGKTSAYENLGQNVDSNESLPADMCVSEDMTAVEMDYQDAVHYAHDIIGDVNHGMNRWIDWNMIVDQNGGPRHVAGGFAAPLVMQEDGVYLKTISFYYILQIAKAIRPGAVRIGCSVYSDEMKVCAVQNVDGCIDVVILNKTEHEQTAVLRMEGRYVELKLEADSLYTIQFE